MDFPFSSSRRTMPTQASRRQDRVRADRSLPALQAQRERGFAWLRFQPRLEIVFRRDLARSGYRTRLFLLLGVTVLHLLTPFYYVWLLQVPAAFVDRAYAVQFGLQLPAVLAATIAMGLWPHSKGVQLMCGLAFLALVAGMLAQRSLGAAYGFDVPAELTGIAIVGMLVIARMPFWSALPWTLVAIAAIVTNEWLFVPSSPAATYHMLTCLILAGIAICAGYAVEYLIRQSWLDHKLLSYLSRHDGLTGLLNRTTLETAIERSMTNAHNAGLSVAVAMVDIDYFKRYNDSYGHRDGDAVIRRVADILHECTRHADDVCGRYGGEEFALLWVGRDYASLCARAEQLCRNAEQAHMAHRRSEISRWVTISIGLQWKPADEAYSATMPAPAVESLAGALLAGADRLLYRAKAEGRNRVVCSHTATQADGTGHEAPGPSADRNVARRQVG